MSIWLPESAEKKLAEAIRKMKETGKPVKVELSPEDKGILLDQLRMSRRDGKSAR